MQGCGNFFDSRVLGHHQMKPARDEVNVRIDLRGFGNDALNARMRTANHQYDAIRRVDGQRQLLHFLWFRAHLTPEQST